MKITLPNNISIENPTDEVLAAILAMAQDKTSTVTISSQPKEEVLSNPYNPQHEVRGKLFGRTEALCHDYFVSGMGPTALIAKYGVNHASIRYNLRKWGVKYGYIRKPGHYPMKQKHLWRVAANARSN